MVLRYVLEGRIWAAAPATVVQGEFDLTAIYTPPGAKGMHAGFSNYVSSLGLDGAPLARHPERRAAKMT